MLLFREGEYIVSPAINPISAATVAIPDSQITTLLHSGPFFRSGV